MSAAAPRRGRSLRNQLLLWLALLHLLATAATAWLSYLAYNGVIYRFLDEQMQLVAAAYQGQQQPAAPQRQSRSEVLDKGAMVVQLWSPDGATLLASSWPPLAVPLQAGPGLTELSASADGHGAQGWRVYTAEAGPNPQQPRVQLLQSEPYRRKRSVKRALDEVLPIVLLLPVALLLLWGIVSAASRSLRAVAREVAAQDEHRIAEMPLQRVPEEIAPLMGAFNGLLMRLRHALAAQVRFVQDAAHELRTPVTAIGLQIENLRAHMPPGEASERFAQLEAGVTRTQHLIEQLLRLSRQEAAASRLPPAAAPERVDVADLLRESVSQMLPLADRRRVDMGCDCQIGPAWVGAAAADLRSVLDNLIDNAVRYAPEGGVVDVRLHREGAHVVVDIADNGPGIEAEWLPRAFDRFFRVPGSAVGGSGLGLAIARAAAERWGLRIELRNRRPEDGGPGLLARVHLPA